MLYGIISVFAGIIVLWQFSTMIGVVLLIVGALLIGKEFVGTGEEPKPEAREYGGNGSQTYNLKSTYRK